MSIDPNISMFIPLESAKHIEPEDMTKALKASIEEINVAVRQGHSYIRILVMYVNGTIHSRVQVCPGCTANPPSDVWENFDVSRFQPVEEAKL